MSLPALAPDDIFAVKYRVVRALRQDGASTLHVVASVDIGKRRLLQRFLNDERAALRVSKETTVWARAAEEHGTALVDQDIDGDLAWLVWEHPDGETLAERVDRAGPLAVDEARSVIVELGHALAKLHAAGVIHREVRPDSIVLERRRSEGAPPRVRLASHVIVDRLIGVASELVLRSAVDECSWIAPEIIRGTPHFTAATDVWAYVLVAFYALVGRRYWNGMELADLAREIIVDPLPPASERAAALGFTGTLPPGFDAWFAACVCRDPDARIGDMAAATRAFAVLFDRPPILANPKGSHYDDGLQGPPPSQPGGYRGGVHGTAERDDHTIRANPKGSYYDSGLVREPRRWPVLLVVIGVVAGVIWAVLSRRH